MDATLEKMSKLLNEFAEAQVVFENGGINVKINWTEPAAEESFNGFAKFLEDEYGKSMKKKSKKSKAGKK